MSKSGSSLKVSEKENIKEKFTEFVKKQRMLFIPEGDIYGFSPIGLHLKRNEKDLLPEDVNHYFLSAYLWSNEPTYEAGVRRFDFSKSDFSFYFKFIRDYKHVLNDKELTVLFKNKFALDENMTLAELAKLNNKNVNNAFFSSRFLTSNMEILADHFKDFSFSKADESEIFNKLEKAVWFKQEGFQKRVYKFVSNCFSEPQIYNKRFSLMGDVGDAVFSSSPQHVVCLEVGQNALAGYNFNCDYGTKDRLVLLEVGLSKLDEHKDLLSYDSSAFISPKTASDNIKIMFFKKDEPPQENVLKKVFSEFIKNALQKNDFREALLYLHSPENLDKIMLDELLSSSKKTVKTHKI